MHSHVHISPKRLRWRHWRGTTQGDTIEGGDTLMKVKNGLNFTKDTGERITWKAGRGWAW